MSESPQLKNLDAVNPAFASLLQSEYHRRGVTDPARKPTMRTLSLILVSLALVGCQYDPHANLYTTTEPKSVDIAGTYVLDAFHLPPEVGSSRTDVVVELHADGTFVATNVPPWELDTPGTNFFTSLLTATGKWEKDTLGTLDPGQKHIWGVYLRTGDSEIHPANFTGDKPPYGLIFTLGDPDSGHAVILKKKL